MHQERRFIKSNGLMCKSPAMRGCLFCYFRAWLHGPAVELPPPDDAASLRESKRGAGLAWLRNPPDR
jgi:hypothetical protein